ADAPLAAGADACAPLASVAADLRVRNHRGSFASRFGGAGFAASLGAASFLVSGASRSARSSSGALFAADDLFSAPASLPDKPAPSAWELAADGGRLGACAGFASAVFGWV